MMKKIFLLILFQGVWAAGFSQSLSLARLGDAFQRTNLNVRWLAQTNSYPHTVWIYQIMPRTFPPAAITNLIIQCGFTEQDKKVSNGDEIAYQNAARFPSRRLQIFHGSIFYISDTHYGPTNLAGAVPEMSQMPKLATNFLLQLGINAAEIEKKSDGTPNFHFWEPFKEYFLPDKIITNIEFRAVGFSRVVDGARVLGAGTVGDGEIYFGPNGRPVHIDLSWRDLKRVKPLATVTPNVVIEWIRAGKAVQGGIPMNLPAIDWSTVKSLTVNSADLCYYAGDRLAPSRWLMPLLSLWTTADTGHGTIDVEIDCPVIDETKL
jgi:hypothetical protein